MSKLKKTIIASVAALALGLGVAASTTPASAGQWRGGWGGGHWGGGGWHGGGWGGGWRGGWRGGGWRGGGWRGGYWGGGWNGCGWGNCWGPAVGVGVLGLAAGAAIADQGCWQVRPVFDQFGNFLGNQSINVCGGY